MKFTDSVHIVFSPHSLLFAILLNLFVSVLSGCNFPAGEKYTIKMAFPAGQYDMLQKTESSGSVVSMSQTFYKTLTVDKPAENGTQKITLSISRLTTTVTEPESYKKGESHKMVTKVFDTDAPDTDTWPMKMQGAFVGAKVSLETDAQGKLGNVQGAAEFIESVKNNPKYSKHAALITFDLQRQLSEEVLTNPFEQIRSLLPASPVAVGEKWKTEIEIDVPMLMKQKLESENRFKKIKTENGRKIAVITAKSVLHSDKPQQVAPKNRLESMDFSAERVTEIDLGSGLILSSVLNIVTKATNTMDFGSQTTTQTGAMKIKVSLTLRPIK
ncbi:MAG: DUF6263 family protein [Planctomycetaceae bacterium]|jgi:hypothetical protein|nr:DUF6263 family protein [Planctomycetaceae bacterium]